MKIIDRYLLKHLLLPFLFCFVSLFCIFVLIDLFDSIGDYATAHAPLWDIIVIYIIMLGQVAPLIIPFAFFLSCVYLLSNLSGHKELVACMAAGISLARLVIPFLCLALLLTGIEYYLYVNLAPTASSRRAELMQHWTKKYKAADSFSSVVYKNPATGVMWYIQQLDLTHNSLTQAEITIPNPNGSDKEKYFVVRGDYRDNNWDFVGVRRITFTKGVPGEPENLGQFNAPFLQETPRQMAAVLLDAESFPWPELREFITAKHQPSAIRMAPYKTEYYRRLAEPCLAPLLCLFAFALGIVHDRKNRAAAIFNCMLILVTVFIFSKITIAFGNKNRLSAELAGWLPIICYGIAGVALFLERVGLWWEFSYVLRERHLWPSKETMDRFWQKVRLKSN